MEALPNFHAIFLLAMFSKFKDMVHRIMIALEVENF